MFCPFCKYQDSKVIDSRDVENGVRRRRECLNCHTRFTTYERIQPTGLLVIKKDKRREEFSREKLSSGIRKACEKRPLPTGTIEKIVDDIENAIFQSGKAEIISTDIGELVMEKLKDIDYIAYIRFASVYREFTDITALKHAVDSLLEDKPTPVSTSQLALIPDERQKFAKSGRRNRVRNN